MQLPERVRMVEVGPRDGLQNEQRFVPTPAKIEFINLLSDAGLPVIEVTSCVPKKLVPQLADYGAVLASIKRRTGVQYPVLVPNLRGLEDGVGAGGREIAVIASASEIFSQKNANCSIEEGLARCRALLEQAHIRQLAVRGYVSCVLGCPYEGAVAAERVVATASALYDAGCREIALADTIGVGTPAKVQAMIQAVAMQVPIECLAVHFHDTYGQGLANILAALQLGITVVDSSVAGLGGCPYAKGATGNVASEDLLYMLDGLGIHTGVDLSKLLEAGTFICNQLGRQNSSKLARALGR